MKDFQSISLGDKTKFDEAVQSKLRDGWQIIGSLQVTHVPGAYFTHKASTNTQLIKEGVVLYSICVGR